MKYKAPTLADLQDTAATFGWKLDKDRGAKLLEFTAGINAAIAYIEEQPDELPPVKYPDRTHRPPTPEENPLGGWAEMTEIAGASFGPLAGRTVAIKDNIFVAGVPLRNGTDILEGFRPDFDATVVTRLLDAGATIKGKAVCEFLCVSGGSATARSGIVHNPVRHGYSAGGSSSGSAALVAGGLADMSLGCDQAGSIRIPSSFCGTVGLKPTHGLVPYTGILGMESTLDYVGPITRTVADNALMLEVIAGPDGYDGRQESVRVEPYRKALGRDLKGMTIGILKEGFGQPTSQADVDDCVRAAAASFTKLGAKVEEVSIPMHPQGIPIWVGVINDGLNEIFRAQGVSWHTESVFSPAFHDAMDGWAKRLPDFPANAQLYLLLGKYLERYHGRYYAKAKNLVKRLRRAYDDALARCDLLLLPTTVIKAIRNPAVQADLLTEEMIAAAFDTISNTCQFDISGHPAMSVPCGLRDGLPVGMMLVGRYFDEAMIYRAAHAFEQSGDWRKR
jgi:amidase